MPCVNSPANGSSTARKPVRCIARVKKRAYSRCRIACSTPPIYWSTGSHAAAAFASTGSALAGLQNRAKYQALSTKVSNVSVSRTAAPPQAGQATCFQVG